MLRKQALMTKEQIMEYISNMTLEEQEQFNLELENWVNRLTIKEVDVGTT